MLKIVSLNITSSPNRIDVYINMKLYESIIN
jgi:hypothetical protein